MKKRNIFGLILLIISIIFVFKGSNNKNLSNYGTILKNEVSIFLGKDLGKECKKVINGEKSEYLEKYEGELISNYKNSLQVLEKNEYISINYVKKGECEKVEEKNKNFCISLKKGEVFGKNGSFENILSKSIIKKENFCKYLSGTLIDDCNSTFKHFNNTDEIMVNKDIFSMDSYERGKTFILYGTGKFITTLNKEFLDKCKNQKYLKN